MDRLVSIVTGAARTRSRNDDDFADRLSSRYTVVFLILFAILVSMGQYVRNPITCWAPKHFHDSHTKFTTNYCWVKDTYYLPWDSNVKNDESHYEPRQRIAYYQWIPFILLGMAVCFFFPSLVWHGFNTKSGVDADSILSASHKLERIDSYDSKKKTLRIITKQIDRFLNSRQIVDFKSRVGCFLSTVFCHCCGRRTSSYLVILFLISKVIYIFNVVFQLVALSYVLKAKFHSFGIDMLSRFFNLKNDWTEDSFVAFPRVTLCDFRIRGQDFANVQNHTVQCVLPVNMYNEKIFLFLWFWMFIVAAVSVINLLIWIARILSRRDRMTFIRNRLSSKLLTNKDNELVKHFVLDYLGQDGCFILRLVAHNTNHVTTTEIINDLWDSWYEMKSSSTPSTSLGSRHLYPEMEMDDFKPLKDIR
ncbi:hypothetical protein HELRODRAFT_185762 [Helobdella robusta]|uniref:Innexin n=1 Tax=Helobdella robusta TaxID=6412 RepID=T1FN93_HELRO|nr:hypothetical protein HELRODRAFT_185762 [Helobdella robusta]ESO00644.1 hypothetical protein HELRODRAFT_185762 [Helobdella robusta]